MVPLVAHELLKPEDILTPEEPRSLDDATLVRIKQLERNDDAAPQVAHEKEQGLNHRSEVRRTAFPC
jgi:hypothetical protein